MAEEAGTGEEDSMNSVREPSKDDSPTPDRESLRIEEDMGGTQEKGWRTINGILYHTGVPAI